MKLGSVAPVRDGGKYLVLNAGYVEVKWIAETDEDIVRHARITTRDIPGMRFRPTNDLIRYLFEHYHTSPFEFPTLCFAVRAPKFVKEQWWRHRTSVVNDDGSEAFFESIDNRSRKYHSEQEFSGRYADYGDDFYIPTLDRMNKQHARNFQASSSELIDDPQGALDLILNATGTVADIRRRLGDLKLARELARIVSPMSQYVVFDLKQDLHNLLWWLQLRRETGAQFEIRAYAEVIEYIVSQTFPYTYEVWRDYAEGTRLTRSEIDELAKLLDGKPVPQKLARKLTKEAA